MKWINRRNVFTRYQEDKLEKRTKENLFGKNSTTTSTLNTSACNNHALHTNKNNPNFNKNLMDKNYDHDDCYCDDEDDGGDISSLFWECIPDVHSQSQFELCTNEITVPNDDDNSNESASKISRRISPKIC